MSPRLRKHTVAASGVLLLAIWLSSGTMNPYAAGVQYPKFSEPCHYIVSVDHYHFLAIFLMLGGYDVQTWHGSVMLRRLLFQVIAFPFAKMLGLLWGGLVASALVNIAACAGFTSFISRRVGETAAIATIWLLATYPGITYWAGLPYSYVAIVPGSLCCMMLLYRLQDAATTEEVLRASLLMGTIFLGYDLHAFFAPAAVLLLAARRRFKWVVVACAGMALMLTLLVLMFTIIGVALLNSSTGNYIDVVTAYLHPESTRAWLQNIANVPAILLSNFFFSNFLVYPILFCAAIAVARRHRFKSMGVPEYALLLSALAVFLFNNAAPPHYGWQLRGHWIARLYQPIFPALLMAIARVTEFLATARWWRGAIAFSVLVNASVAFGPIMMNPLAAHVYRLFYIHAPAETLLINLQRYGRRPLGFCHAGHEWDDMPDPNTLWNRPAFMYRYPPSKR